MTEEECITAIYASWQKAQAHQDWNVPDRDKRHPEFTAPWLSRPVKVPTVLVTGSKGKGSTARMLAALLSQKGPCGLFTSPHVRQFRERIQVDGRMIPREDFIRLTQAVLQDLETVDLAPGQCLSPIGIQAMVARRYFAEQGVAFQVFECGKGVQYDDVGNIPHQWAIITPIFQEHVRELGPELVDIARDKAHILTPGTRQVFLALQEPAVLGVLLERAAQYGTKVSLYGRDFLARYVDQERGRLCFEVQTDTEPACNVCLNTTAAFQARNAALAVAAAQAILEGPVSTEALSQLGFPGRQEILRKEPFLILDACIHEQAARQLARTLKERGIKEAILVLAVPDDKDFLGVARTLAPYVRQIRVAKISADHYVITPHQLEVLQVLGLPLSWHDSIASALCDTTGPVVIAGTAAAARDVYPCIKEE